MPLLRCIFLLGTLCSLVFLTGCKEGEANEINRLSLNNVKAMKLVPHEYIRWCKDEANGLSKSKPINDITFKLQYKPADYLMSIEMNDEQQKVVSSETREEFISMDYFDFTIGLSNDLGEILKYKLGSPVEYDARVNYFSFEMQRDLKIVDGKDTLNCEAFHFERTYDIAPYATFLLGFPKVKSEEVTFLYYDRVFGKGLIKFTYKKEVLRSLPQLNGHDEV